MYLYYNIWWYSKLQGEFHNLSYIFILILCTSTYSYMPQKIYIIDGNSFIYRMFFALPLFSDPEWNPVNATYWMAKFFTGQMIKESPDTLIFVQDAKWNNFRHEIYSEYKATRERMPEDLKSQLSDIREMIKLMQIPVLEIAGYEADDVIATLATTLERETNDEIYILSGDKDLYKLVSEQVKIYDTQKKKISGPENTLEKFGVPSCCVTDYLAICGDSSDNIPWIKGIWPKKAITLLNYFWDLESIYEWLDKVDKIFEELPEKVQKLCSGKTLDKLLDGKENAFLSQKLATLILDVDIWDFSLSDHALVKENYFTPQVQDFFAKKDFKSLLQNQEVEKQRWSDTWLKVQVIWDEQWLIDLSSTLEKYSEVCLDTETTSLNVREAKLTGISMYFDEEHIYYINVAHNGPCVNKSDLLEFLAILFKSSILIIWHNLKYDLQILENYIKKTDKLVSDSLWQTALEI